jgi:radical SAM superfamily enzyme YgiQ (UPF0313 family)
MKMTFFNMLFEMGTLGLLNVVTYLEQNGYPATHVYLVKMQEETDEELDSILSFVQQEEPDLIGFSLMTFNFRRTRRITVEIKKRFPHIPIVWGGIHPTFEPEESIQYADYVCIGEGEETLLELVQALDRGSPTHSIRNLWSKQDGRVIRNDVRALIRDLDDYPFPRTCWERTYCLDESQIKPFSHDLYRRYVSYSGTMYDIMVSRGCPYSCSYCCNALLRGLYRDKGKYVRYRSIGNVMEELQYARKEFPYINMINIQDDGFASAREEYLKEFSEVYKEDVGLPIRLRIIPTMFSEKKARYLSDANTLVAVLGIQSSDRINKEIFHRQVSSEKLIAVTKLLKKYNIVGQYDLITQNPYETEQDMVEICETLAQIPKPYQLIMFPLAMFPNTPLRAKAIQDGIPVNEEDGYATTYGNYPIRFPYLHQLQQVCPYTPKFLIYFFLRNRHRTIVRNLFVLYHRYVYAAIDRMRSKIMKNTKWVNWTKKVIFLPNFLLSHCRKSLARL